VNIAGANVAQRQGLRVCCGSEPVKASEKKKRRKIALAVAEDPEVVVTSAKKKDPSLYGMKIIICELTTNIHEGLGTNT